MIEGVVNYCMKKVKTNKFHGTFTDLLNCIQTMGYEVRWKDEGENLCVVRTMDGGVVNWWKSTRTIQFQGIEQVKNKLQNEVLRELTNF